MESFVEVLSVLLGMALVLGGLVGTVLPILPGAPLVFFGLWLLAWAGDYQRVGAPTRIAAAVLALLTVLIDFAASALGARRVGASRQAVSGALLGSVAGMFLGIPGLLLGPFVGAMVGELMAQRSVERAASVGIATWIGLVLGSAAKLALCLAMVLLFAFAWFI